MGRDKSKKAFLPFPYNGSDTISGFAHFGLALQCKLFGKNPHMYAQEFSGKDWNGVAVSEIPDKFCRICGFSLISINASNGWSFETCSAHEIGTAIKNGTLAKFLGDIGSEHTYNQNDDSSRVLNLQQPKA